MLAHYDLRKSPATWDYVNWLARSAAKADGLLDVNIVMGTRDWSLRDKQVSKDRREWAARDLLPQISWLHQKVRSVSFVQEGTQTEGYDHLGYSPGPVFRASPFARETVAKYLRRFRRPVSISMRNSTFQPSRNSNWAEWHKVADWLIKNHYAPIFVPDIEDALTGSMAYAPAALNADIRLALYEQCELNLMTNHGPILLALMSSAPVAAFKMTDPTIASASIGHMAQSYLHPKAKWGHNKRIFWMEDNAADMIPFIEKILASQQEPQSA